MSEKFNCVLLTVCSKTDEHGLEMLEKSLNLYGWNYNVIITEWKGFGTKLIATYDFLKTNPNITHFFFCDAYDVVVLSTIEEALDKIQDKSKMLIGAERGLWPGDLEEYRDRFEQFEHGYNFPNSGLYFAPREVFMAYFEENPPEYSTDDQKWLIETYLNQKHDNIVLDNNCDVFQNYSFLRDYDFNFDPYDKRIKNHNTGSLPVFIHGNGRTDMSPVYGLIIEEPTKTFESANKIQTDIDMSTLKPWHEFIGMFLTKDTDDEMLQEYEEDIVFVDMSKVVAFYPSSHKGFIKLDLGGTLMYCVKSNVSEVKKLLSI